MRSAPSARAALLSALGLAAAVIACDRVSDLALREVALPGLDPLPRSVRLQLSGQYDRLQELLADGSAGRSTLGEAFGTMGKLFLAYGLAESAEPALLNAADLLPDDPRWSYYAGFLYKSTGRVEQAVDYFERVLEENRLNDPARIHLAEAYIELARPDDAKELLNEVLLRDPDAAGAHFLLGQIAESEDLAEAITHYETVLRLQPDASVVHYPLGLAYRRQGDLERSREHLARRGGREIAVRDPFLEELERIRVGPEANLLRGSELARQGRDSEAIAAFERVLAEDSANVSAYLNLGMLYARTGDPGKAIASLQQALHLDPLNSRAHFNLGQLYRGRGEHEAAIAQFEAALAADSGNSAADFALADLLWSERRCAEAIAHLVTYLAANPANVEARLKQAICHAELRQYRQARELIEAGYQAFPDRTELHDALVRVLAASPDASVRDGPRALALAERLTESVRRPETMESLAMAYAEVGRFSEAIRIQEELIRLTEERGMVAMTEHLQSNLRRYRAQQPCRTPWPPTVFHSP